MAEHKILSYNAPFETIKSTENRGEFAVDDFAVVTQIDFLDSEDDEYTIQSMAKLTIV